MESCALRIAVRRALLIAVLSQPASSSLLSRCVRSPSKRTENPSSSILPPRLRARACMPCDPTGTPGVTPSRGRDLAATQRGVDPASLRQMLVGRRIQQQEARIGRISQQCFKSTQECKATEGVILRIAWPIPPCIPAPLARRPALACGCFSPLHAHGRGLASLALRSSLHSHAT